MTKTKLNAKEFLANHGEKRGVSWFKLLDKEVQVFIMELVDKLKGRPDISLHSTASALIKELEIDRNTETVVRTLKEFIHNA